MQRESSLDRLLQEKMATLLSQDHTSKSNTDVNALKRSLFEVQVLVKRLYPNNEEASKIILKTRDLFQEQLGISDKKITVTTEMIFGCAKEIAHAIGLELPIDVADGGNGKSE